MYKFKNTLMLTGAGFTANFGGIVAKEMWSRIFNNQELDNAPLIKQELKKSFDFEKIYSRIIQSRSSFKPEEIKAFEKAVSDAYGAMDNDIRPVDWFDRARIHSHEFMKFLSFFTDRDGEKIGTYFTLNQDLFPERHLSWTPLGFQKTHYYPDQDAPEMMLPSDDEVTQAESQEFLYIKLHGSTNWVSEKGSNIKILGINKKEAIDKIPLLKKYFDIFESAIYRTDVKLLIIGYGFQDEHINKCLIKAIREYGLKIFVLSTTSPGDFYFLMNFKYPQGSGINEIDESKKPIWDALNGYFPYRMSDVFPIQQKIPARRMELYKSVGIS